MSSRLPLALSAVALSASLSACAIREARIPVSAPLAESTERLELRGMGYGESGDFALAEAHGTFSRRAERSSIFGPLLVAHRGGGTFALDAAATWPELAGRCTYREGRVTLGPISVTPRRLALACEFARDGRPIDAGLVIEDPQPAHGTLHGRSEREGEIYYEGSRISVRSIHRDAGGGLPNPAPLGYVFSLDGEEIGAVDINGGNKTIFAPRGPEREAVIAGAMALSVLWDPAHVQAD